MVKFRADDILGVDKSKPVFSNQQAAARAAASSDNKKDIYSYTYEQVMPFDAGEKAAMLQGRIAAVDSGLYNMTIEQTESTILFKIIPEHYGYCIIAASAFSNICRLSPLEFKRSF